MTLARYMDRYDDWPGLADHSAAPDDSRAPDRTEREIAAPVVTVRYSDQPMDWRTRLTGMGGTAMVGLLVLAASLLTWRAVQPIIAPPVLSVFDVSPPAAPPQPVQEVPEGPQQVEQEENRPEERELPEPPPPAIKLPSTLFVPVEKPVEQVKPADPVPQTTAPKSLPAPPASQVSSDAEATWEALLLAHLEQHRSYPPRARQRREQGVAHVRFRMNRAGRVLSAEIERSSGSAVLDRAALETIRRAQPLPAIPADRPDELELNVPVEFFVR